MKKENLNRMFSLSFEYKVIRNERRRQQIRT
jgi:hypothetical protein